MPKDSHQTPPAAPVRVPRGVKLVVSAAIVFHMFGVFVSPAAMPPSSSLFRELREGYRPYLEAMYLSHGYQFFAPNPGPSTLVSYTVTTADGNAISGRFPNREIWPRLLYHRHFMLTERMWELGDLAAPSYARHLCHKYRGETVGLTRIIHSLPTMQMVRDGVTLDAPAGYAEQPIGVFRCEDLQ